MKRESELEFLESNVDESILIELYNKSYNNLEKLNEKVDRFTLYLTIVVILFFVSMNVSIESFEIDIITIKDTSVITKILPFIFFELLYMIITMSMHKSELYFGVKKLGRYIYKNNYENFEIHTFQNNFIDRLSLPFSFSSFGNQMVLKNGGLFSSLLGIIVSIPALIIAFSPIVIGFLMMKNIYLNHFNDLLGKVSFFISLWVILTIIYTLIIWTIKNNGEELR
jgi:hypothetical protein